MTGFAVYRDNGDNSESVVEVNSANDLAVRNNPGLRELTVTNFPASSVGKSFKFRIRAFNREGSSYSQTATFTLAGVPQAPSVAPIDDPNVTSNTRIGVRLTALTTVTQTGGSPVLFYEVSMKRDGAFEVVQNSTLLSLTVSNNILESRVYGFMYRAYNVIGPGPYSAETYITAATKPSTPAKPKLVSVDSTQISLVFTPSADDGGMVVTKYELQMEASGVVTPVTKYDATPLAMTLQLTQTGDSLTVGEIYTFSFRAYNDKGYSSWSEGLVVSLVDTPATPTSPQVDRALSDTQSLYIYWSRVADGPTKGGLITGYELQLDDASHGNYHTVYYGVGQPIRTYFKATSLITGARYNARIRSYNYNGYGTWSPIARFEVCIAPSGMPRPEVIETTKTTIKIQWALPTNNGGCTITGYAVFIADETTGVFEEANSDYDINVRDLPSLNELLITRIAAGSEGKRFRIYVKVFNAVGEASSPIASTILATVPDAPPVPVLVSSASDDKRITIDISGFPTSSNGGSEVVSFEIQWAQGKAGSFVSLVGSSTPFTASTFTQSTDVVKGTTYRFRYRAKNVHGFGAFSPELEVIAATVPQAPSRPELISVTSSLIKLKFKATEDNGGLPVSDYELWIDGGSTSSAFTKFTSYVYATHGFSYDVDVSTASLTVGQFYRFRYLARNSIGASSMSNSLRVPVADVPSTPPSLSLIAVSKTSVQVEWVTAASTGSPAGDIRSYKIYRDDGLSGSYNLIFEGSATVRKLISTSLVTGYFYKYKYSAVNAVGSSAYSTPVGIYACIAPKGMAAPTAGVITKTSIEVFWTAPTDNGGCPISGYELYVSNLARSAYNEVHAADINNKPSLRTYVITDLPAGAVGNRLNIQVKVKANELYLSSPILEV